MIYDYIYEKVNMKYYRMRGYMEKELNKKKKIILYSILLFLSVVSFALVFIFDASGVVGYLITLVTFYIFFGSIIKLCRLSEKFKNGIINFIDLLFWLP